MVRVRVRASLTILSATRIAYVPSFLSSTETELLLGMRIVLSCADCLTSVSRPMTSSPPRVHALPNLSYVASVASQHGSSALTMRHGSSPGGPISFDLLHHTHHAPHAAA